MALLLCKKPQALRPFNSMANAVRRALMTVKALSTDALRRSRLMPRIAGGCWNVPACYLSHEGFVQRALCTLEQQRLGRALRR